MQIKCNVFFQLWNRNYLLRVRGNHSSRMKNSLLHYILGEQLLHHKRMLQRNLLSCYFISTGSTRNQVSELPSTQLNYG